MIGGSTYVARSLIMNDQLCGFILSCSPSYPTTKTVPLSPPSLVVRFLTLIPVNAVPRAVPIVRCVAAVDALLISGGRGSGCSSSSVSSSAMGGKPFGSLCTSSPVECSALSGSRVSMVSSEVAGEGLAVVETAEDVRPSASLPRLNASAFSLSLSYCLVACFMKRRYCKKDCIAVEWRFPGRFALQR